MRVSWLEVRVLCLKGILPPRVYFSSLGVWAHCRYRYDAISAEVWSLFMDKQSFVCIVPHSVTVPVPALLPFQRYLPVLE